MRRLCSQRRIRTRHRHTRPPWTRLSGRARKAQDSTSALAKWGRQRGHSRKRRHKRRRQRGEQQQQQQKQRHGACVHVVAVQGAAAAQLEPLALGPRGAHLLGPRTVTATDRLVFLSASFPFCTVLLFKVLGLRKIAFDSSCHAGAPLLLEKHSPTTALANAAWLIAPFALACGRLADTPC